MIEYADNSSGEVKLKPIPSQYTGPSFPELDFSRTISLPRFTTYTVTENGYIFGSYTVLLATAQFRNEYLLLNGVQVARAYGVGNAFEGIAQLQCPVTVGNVLTFTGDGLNEFSLKLVPYKTYN